VSLLYLGEAERCLYCIWAKVEQCLLFGWKLSDVFTVFGRKLGDVFTVLGRKFDVSVGGLQEKRVMLRGIWVLSGQLYLGYEPLKPSAT